MVVCPCQEASAFVGLLIFFGISIWAAHNILRMCYYNGAGICGAFSLKKHLHNLHCIFYGLAELSKFNSLLDSTKKLEQQFE